MTIGPVGLDIPLRVPTTGRWSGDTLSVAGSFGAQSTTNPTIDRVLRSQFQGLAAYVGEVVPVTFGGTPELDGWYMLDRPQISTSDASFAHGVFDWSCELERVRSSATVQQELRLLGAGRTNSHSLTTVRRGWFSPGVNTFGTMMDYDYQDTDFQSFFRSGSDGAMPVIIDTTISTYNLYDNTARWWVAPEYYHSGGCLITVQADNGTYYRVVGTEIQNKPTKWAIGNTLVSVIGSTTTGVAEFSMIWHDGTSWESYKTLRMVKNSSYDDLDYVNPVLVQIMRNDVDACAIRVVYAAIGGQRTHTLDIAVKRGARHVEFVWRPNYALSPASGVRLTTPEAGTAHTSGLHATSADASGNKYIMTSPRTITAGTTNGRFYRATPSSGDQSLPFMIGVEMAGVGYGFDTFTENVYYYMGAVSTRQRTVVG